MQFQKIEHDRLVRGIAKGAGVVFISTIIARVLGYSIRALIAREYGPEGYGLVSTSIAILTITSMIALLGFTNALSRQIPYYLNTGRKSKIRNLVLSAYGISTALAVVLGLMIFIYSEDLAIKIYNNELLIPFLRYFALGLIFFVWLQLASSVFKAFKEMVLYVVFKDLFRFSTIFIAILIAILIESSTEDIGLYYLISYCIVGIAGTIYIFNFIVANDSPLEKPFSESARLFKFSFPLVLASIAYSFLLRVDILMIGYFNNQIDVGIYDAAVRIAELLILVLGSFTPFLLPAMTEYYANKDIKKVAIMYSISTKWIFILTIPIFTFIFFFPEFFLNLIFGPQFSGAAPVLKIISLGYIFSSSVGATGSILIVLGKTKINFYNNLFVLGLNIGLNYFLIPRYGIIGAGIASTISLVVLNTIMLLQIYKFIGLQPFSYIFIKIGLIALILTWTMQLSYTPRELLSGLLYFILFGGLYILFLKLTKCFDENDFIIFREFAKRIEIPLNWLRK